MRNALRPPATIEPKSAMHCASRLGIEPRTPMHSAASLEIEPPRPMHCVANLEIEPSYAMHCVFSHEIELERSMHCVSTLTREPRAPLPLVIPHETGHRPWNTSSHGVVLGERGGIGRT